MEENNIENKEELPVAEVTPVAETIVENKPKTSQTPIVSAIIIAGVLIAGAVLLRGGISPLNGNTAKTGTGIPVTTTTLAPITSADRTLGNQNAKVTLVMYEDFQCPWCGKFVGESEQVIRDKYVKDGSVQFVYRDFAFLGSFAQPYVLAKDESINSAEAARCAGDQGQFWQYHDYLFAHQNGEDQGAFSVTNLESFAKTLGLNTTTFNQCLSTNKYAQAVSDSKTEGEAAGVTGTPKGFILVNGKVVDTIDGYLPLASVTAKLDAALKD
ncbi:MAG: thioredoxin domain-containing protein [Candidatus Pacebacteria bacterium]|nr:thioredoxin domain-containing protein [Candidatus Paceibacterota bacterium]